MRRYAGILLWDLRHAVRNLWRTPAFTLAAVFAMAAGVGAGTAVFSVVDRILFRSLPYPQGENLVSFGMAAPIAPQEFILGYDFLDWRTRQAPFESMAYWAGAGDCDLTEAAAVRLRCGYIDSALLTVLKLQPVVGRNFNPRENAPNAPKVALISHALWRSRFAADPRLIGRTVPLDGVPATVVGVLPPQFEMPDLAPVDVLLPHTIDEVEQRSRRTATLLWAVGRLKPGVTPGQAYAALQPLFQDAMKYVSPAFRRDVSLRVRPLRDRQVLDARLASWILLASVAAVMLIACANVANLLLARAAARRRELAMRAALGAAGGRLVMETLTESVVLALAGGAAGCAFAAVLVRVFVAIAPEGIPRLGQAGVDARVLAFALALSSLSGILAGLAPAVRRPRAEALSGWRTVGGSHHLFRHGLVAAQIAISMILLAGAGLLLRTLWNLETQPLGMRTRGVLTAGITLGRRAYSDAARRAGFFAELEARIRRIPGVEQAALTDSLPPAGNAAGAMLFAAIDVPGRPRMADGTGGPVTWRLITPGYFAALGIPILRGRGFNDDDRGPDRHVVILSELLARRMFPGEEPLGKQIRPGRNGPWLTVIGVAGNVKNTGAGAVDDPEYYEIRKLRGAQVGRAASAVIRSSLAPAALAGLVRAEVSALDPTLPVTVETLGERTARFTQRARFNALLLAIFAAIGLLLAATGLYGVMSFLVAQRTGEIGVRMALGATPAAIARLVLKQAGGWTAAGTALGLLGSLFVLRMLRAVLFHVSAGDPAALAAAAALLYAVALAAAWLPARRSARIDPMAALRHE